MCAGGVSRSGLRADPGLHLDRGGHVALHVRRELMRASEGGPRGLHPCQLSWV